MRECGRSMVEMLGVLAIIGVLSVGAIAGYSKAMMKYKLNKFSESYNILLNYALQYTPQLETNGVQTQYNEILYKLNLIPDGMTYEAPRIYDMFHNQVDVYSNNSAGVPSYVLALYINKSNDGKQICHSTLVAVKENVAQISYVVMKDEEFNGDGGNDTSSSYLYGDTDCNGTRRCLRNLTISDIADICGFCDTAVYQCKIMVTWQD